MKSLIGIIVGLTSSAFGAMSVSNVLPNKRDWVADYVDKVHLFAPHRGAEGSCTPKVTAYFLDEFAKGIALIADTTFYDRSGFSWCVVPIGGEGRDGHDFQTGDCCAHLWCREFELFIARFEGRFNRFVALNAEVDLAEIEKGVARREKSYYGDVLIGSKGGLGKLLSASGLDDVVRNPGFRRIERAPAEIYTGFDLKLILPDQRHFIPARENLPNGGLAAPADFKSFARRYRDEVKRRLGLTRPVTVYAVFLDADLDGDADCYVSSDAEAVGNGRYRWTLHLNDANVFRKAKERVWRNRKTIHDVAMLEPEDVAGKDSFYRVVRTYGSPQILVMESDGKRLHTHAYTHLLSEEDRTRRPSDDPELKRNGKFCMEDWEGEMEGKYGFMPPKDFRDQISYLFFHHLERLPCEEFPEK